MPRRLPQKLRPMSVKSLDQDGPDSIDAVFLPVRPLAHNELKMRLQLAPECGGVLCLAVSFVEEARAVTVFRVSGKSQRKKCVRPVWGSPRSARVGFGA